MAEDNYKKNHTFKMKMLHGALCLALNNAEKCCYNVTGLVLFLCFD
jgi:hypothetical protein